MQQTSDLYKELFAAIGLPYSKVRMETRLSIGETGRLITKRGERITFGGTAILVGVSGADAGFDESTISAMGTELRLFSENYPVIGSCVAGEISVKMLKPSGDIPRQARLVPYVRLTDGERYSEWIQKGVFYIDTRVQDDTSDNLKWITITGYDAILKAEADYPPSTLSWPAKDIDVVREIAGAMDVSVDARTVQLMNRGYPVQYPGNYSQRETLGFIAAAYAGCFVMSDLGELRLIVLNDLPEDTSYLVVSQSDRRTITFGGDRIRV